MFDDMTFTLKQQFLAFIDIVIFRRNKFQKNNLEAILGPYSQHFISFLTCKSAQQTRALHNTRLERLANEKYSNLLVTFES
jgi:hypothetical protein